MGKDNGDSDLKSYRLHRASMVESTIKLDETGKICVKGGGMSEWP